MTRADELLNRRERLGLALFESVGALLCEVSAESLKCQANEEREDMISDFLHDTHNVALEGEEWDGAQERVGANRKHIYVFTFGANWDILLLHV